MTLKKGAIVGPFAVVDDGSSVEGGAIVERSVRRQSVGFSNSTLFGSILAKAAVIKKARAFRKGRSSARGPVVGEGAVIYEGVKIWPRKIIAAGSHVHFNVVTGTQGKRAFL